MGNSEMYSQINTHDEYHGPLQAMLWLGSEQSFGSGLDWTTKVTIRASSTRCSHCSHLPQKQPVLMHRREETLL